MNITEKFWKRLKELRAKKNVTQEEIAFEAKVSVYYISKLERGIANPSLEMLSRLAKSLKISLSDLVQGM